MDIEELQAFLKALASEKRQHILFQFMDNKELTVNKIAEKAEIGQSTASEHLAVLKRAGILVSRKKGQEVYYYPNREKVMRLLQQLNNYLNKCC